LERTVESPPGKAAARLTVAARLTAAAIALASLIAVSQACYAAALILFTASVWRGRTPSAVRVPAFLYPFSLYAVLTIASAVVSLEPGRSLPRLRELLLYGMAILVASCFHGERLGTWLLRVVAASGVVLAGWGLVQYLRWSVDIRARIRGPISHYMTYSGILMLATVVCLVLALWARRPAIGVAYGAATAFLGAVLLLTRTRSAYLGLAAAVVALVAWRRPRLLAFAPVVAVGILALVPPSVFHRIRSIADPRDETNLARYYLWRGGLAIVGDYPYLGVGPHMVRKVYNGRLVRTRGGPEPYRDPRTPTRSDTHLHNNVLQVAAEKGLPALAAWLAMVGTMAATALRSSRAEPASPLGPAALLSLAAFLVAGLFEYNAGDSEVLLVLLALVSLGGAGSPATGPGAGPVPA
jgi:O-antigen ligase